MNTHLNWKQRLAKKLMTPEQFEQSLADIIKEEQDLLQRDILNRSLNMIDAKYKLAGQRERLRFLGNYMLGIANEVSPVVDQGTFDQPTGGAGLTE